MSWLRTTALAGLCYAAIASPFAGMQANAQYIPGAPGASGGGGGGGSPGGATNAVQYNAGSGNFGGVTLGTAKLLLGQASGVPAGETMGGDCTIAATGAITCLDTNGVAFGTFATQNYASPPAIGGTTPAAGAFTTLGASGNLTTNITGSTQCVHANSSGVLSGTGGDCGAGGGGSVAFTDGTHSVTPTTLTVGNGFVIGGSGSAGTLNATVPDATQASGYSIAAGDMSGQENFKGSSLTVTFPAISSTVFASGMSAVIPNRNSTALTISSTPTVNGLASASSIYQYGWASCTSNGTSLDCFGFPGFGALSGDLTATGAGVVTLKTSVALAGSPTTTTQSAGDSSTKIATTAFTQTILSTADQTLSGGANVTSDSLGTKSSGTTTIDCGANPLQYLTDGGAFTLAAPANDGSCMVLVTNNGSAGTITFSGFSVGSNTGDAIDTTSGHKFTLSIWRINSVAGYRIAAMQ